MFFKGLHHFFFFFNCYLAAPQPALGHYRGGSLTHPMLITCVLHIKPEGHWEPCSEVASLSPAKRLVGFELGTFRFWSQCLNPLGHFSTNSKQNCTKLVKCTFNVKNTSINKKSHWLQVSGSKLLAD